jgi:hypothetical protein
VGSNPAEKKDTAIAKRMAEISRKYNTPTDGFPLASSD